MISPMDRIKQKIAEQKAQANPPAESVAKVKPQELDGRFKSSAFRAAFHVVCDYLGQPPTMATFKAYDATCGGVICDWPLFAEGLMTHPYIARVTLVRSNKTIAVQLIGASRQAALERLDARQYEFREWLE